MKSKSGSSKTSSAKKQQTSTDEVSIYDVPGVVLDIRRLACTLLEKPETVGEVAPRLVELTSKAIRAMGMDDVGKLEGVGKGTEAEANPAA
jgi:hypothetical protein